ncbi:hypothetical protein RRG08_055930 [Elysia crispata]|uniref:Uncharacterized protein n=1 Tax=Elysia crispata TaxID=231223 RepID=A0AAE1DWR7_9GAST|nr:hypothetical protein RRG08_055930 [Elysia crispata]
MTSLTAGSTQNEVPMAAQPLSCDLANSRTPEIAEEEVPMAAYSQNSGFSDGWAPEIAHDQFPRLPTHRAVASLIAGLQR